MLAYLSRSRRHASMISLSDVIPSARNTMNRGTGFLTLGIDTTMFLLVYFLVGATKSMRNERTGFDGSSDTLFISAE